MNVDLGNLNLIFGWLWICLGFISGLVLGCFFHRENWLGGYGSFRRRLYRLAHISFFGLGAANLLFAVTAGNFREAAAGQWAGWAFIVGGLTMPACCVAMAHVPKARLLFAVPVLCLLFAGALSLWHATHGRLLASPSVAVSVTH